jgi:RimJ/RimL family protein N-acetyltransferase
VINLRPVAAADLRQLRAWEQEPAVARWLATTASALDARESAEQEYERLLRSPRIKLLAIETKAGDLVGLLRLHDLDLIHRKAQVRLFVAPAQQQRGYGADALRTAARFCFEELGLRRLGLVVRADHPHAQRLYERLGFRVEGREREAAWSEGRWVDFVQMGLLAREWRSRQSAEANEPPPTSGEGE